MMTKVKYIGNYYKVMFDKDKVYDLIGVVDGLYKVYSDEFEDWGLFSPEDFEIVSTSNVKR